MITVFIDIDGTIADNSHRLHFLETHGGRKKDFESFYDPGNVFADWPIHEAVRPLGQLMASPLFYDVIFLTGRPERTRAVTREWFWAHFGVDDIKIEMRGDKDWRKASTYKEDAIKRLRTPSSIFIDDDLRNKDMYQKYGLFLHAPRCWDYVHF